MEVTAELRGEGAVGLVYWLIDHSFINLMIKKLMNTSLGLLQPHTSAL